MNSEYRDDSIMLLSNIDGNELFMTVEGNNIKMIFPVKSEDSKMDGIFHVMLGAMAND